jgi:hypothetical protein
MMTDKRFDRADAARTTNFLRVILKNQPIPDDLQKLWNMQISRAPDADFSVDPLAALGVKIIEPDRMACLLDHSYLNETDRADPDMMMNIEAINEVFKLATFVVELEDDDILGYWHGLENTPIDQAPIIKFDNEGQFSICQGNNLTEAIISATLGYKEDQLPEFKAWFAKYHIDIVANSTADLPERQVTSHPGLIHKNLYQDKRVAAGLENL